MSNETPLVFSGIVPHPPIMVEEVGRESVPQVQGSIDAMRELTARVLESGAETVIIISPHAPLDPEAFVAYRDADLYGDFAHFRAPDTKVSARLDNELLDAIIRSADRSDYQVIEIRDFELDHGIAVPLYFLRRNGWQGRVVALGYSFLANEDHLRFGRCVKQAIDEVGKPVAFIASGDLSHRLKPDAPAGYQPTAFNFDREVVEAIDSNCPDRIVNIDPELRRVAGECGYRSMLVAFGATQDLPPNCETLHYEAPFGVGYLVAQLTNASEQAGEPKVFDQLDLREAEDTLPRLARKAVESYVLSGVQITYSADTELLKQRAACFVSIRKHSGELRGCIGTIDPVKDSLADELITNAIHAATRDPRFPPVLAAELEALKYSVDILGPPEPAVIEELDASVYGVIVEDESGSRRGLLLPDIEGVDSVVHQIEIAARKAGIPPDVKLRLSRFRVQRFRE